MRLGLRTGDEMFLRAYRKYGPSTKVEEGPVSSSSDQNLAGRKRKGAHQSTAASKKQRRSS